MMLRQLSTGEWISPAYVIGVKAGTALPLVCLQSGADFFVGMKSGESLEQACDRVAAEVNMMLQTMCGC